jgi:nitrogen fixation/metabolism regulation signal transduction histidine kinase
MKLAAKLTSGFVLASILPLCLVAFLLYLFAERGTETAFSQKTDIAVISFRSFMEDQLSALEKNAAELSQEKDLLIDLLDLPGREADLTRYLEQRIAAGEFEFALIRVQSSQGVFKAYQNDLSDLISSYRFPVNSSGLQSGSTGLVRLSSDRSNSVAAVATVPVFYRDEPVGELMIGRLLTAMAASYRLDRSGLAALLVTSGGRVVFANADSSLVPNAAGLTSPNNGEASWDLTVGDHSLLARQTQIMGMEGKPIAAIVYLFDQTELTNGKARLVRIFVLLALSALLLSFLLGYLFSRSIARPVSEMSHAARQIAAGAVPEKIIHFSDDEIGDLAAGINRLTEDLKVTEIKLRRSEQVAAWQMFARQTAHEIKNFLMPVTTTVSALQRFADTGQLDRARISDAVHNIQAEVMRMKQLLGSFVEFAKLPAPTFQRIHGSLLVDELNETFSELVRGGQLHVSVEGQLPTFECDSGQVRQVLLNLISNSFEANATVVQVRIVVAEDRVVFEIVDDGEGLKVGQGIDPFTPMYTTKSRGSGLGLAICRRIIVDHGGDITYQANATGGTLFSFYLPLERV